MTAPAQPDLRQQIARALCRTATTGWAEHRNQVGPRYLIHAYPPGSGGHNYDATCALCCDDVDALADAVLVVVQPILDQRAGCPDPIECDHEAEVGQLREQLAGMVNLSQARMTLQMFRRAIGSTATQITDLIHGINRATGPMARAQREAAHYRARWESTVVEARRQAARADTAEQAACRCYPHPGDHETDCPLAAAPSATT